MTKSSVDMSKNRLPEIALPSPLQKLEGLQHPHLWVKRDDLIHPIISGNKWRKLQGFISQIEQQAPQKIISFGGGYSNHLHALGYLCKQLGIPLVAMVRGNYALNMTPMLKDLLHWQSEIHWLTKLEYQQKQDLQWLSGKVPNLENCLMIPEGGSAKTVHLGMQTLVQELPEDLDVLLCPVASGGTLAGLIQSFQQQQRKTRVIGIAVLKGQDYLENLVRNLFTADAANQHPWQIIHDYHFGGYAKSNDELMQFCQDFTHSTAIPLEPVYSGKVFFALQQLLNKGYFAQVEKVAVLHTGGLQGHRQ